jgi:hypothetical protein
MHVWLVAGGFLVTTLAMFSSYVLWGRRWLVSRRMAKVRGDLRTSWRESGFLLSSTHTSEAQHRLV